ncbi:MAG: helix-hairpin-helix domain-containing protein [Candidatus Hydrogenedentota bacterium]
MQLNIRAFIFCVLLLSTAAALHAAGEIDINTATIEELDKLPGIGAAKAKAIVEHRAAKGPFRTVDDLQIVKGIGKERLDKFRNLVTVGGAGATSPRSSFVPQNSRSAPNSAPPRSPQSPPPVEKPAEADEIVSPADEYDPDDTDESPVSRTITPVDINTCDEAALDQLPWISPFVAKQIIERRTAEGGFKNPWELLNFLRYNKLRILVDSGLVNASVRGESPGNSEPPPKAPERASSMSWLFIGVAVIGIVFIAWFVLRRRDLLGDIAERALSKVNLRPRLALVSILSAAGAGLLTWVIVEQFVVRTATDRFDARREEMRRILHDRWSITYNVTDGSAPILTSSWRSTIKAAKKSEIRARFIADSATIARMDSGERGNFANIENAYSWAVGLGHKLGVEATFIDLRGLVPEMYFPPTIPREIRKPLKDALIADTRAVFDDLVPPVLAIEAKSGGREVFLIVGRSNIDDWGILINLVHLDALFLEHMKIGTGIDLICTATDTVVATTIWDGRPVVTTPELNVGLLRDFDWRPTQTLSPFNLQTATPEDLKVYLDLLAIANAEAIGDALAPCLGPAGQPYSSEEMRKIPGLDPSDADILSGLFFRENPETWEAGRSVYARPRVDGEIVELNGREFIVTTLEKLPRDVTLQFLVDRTAYVQEVAAIRWTAFGGVAIVFLLSFVGIQLVGHGIVRPVYRLDSAIGKVGQGDLTPNLDSYGRDELSRIATGFNHMVVSIKERLQLESAFRKYVPGAVVREAAKGQATLGGSLHTCSIMFADVRGFTHASQLLPASEVVRLLNLYFVPVVEEVIASGGVVDKFIGDAVLAVWGAPEPVDDYADRAIAAAIKMQERIYEINNERARLGQMQLFFGIGIATGEVLAGHVGTPERTDWTVIGSDVNLSQRISSKAWPYRIFISDRTLYSLRNPVPVKEYQSLALKGFAQPVAIHAVIWYQGHSGPLLSENDPGGWHLWNGTSVEGPFTLEELIRTPGFSVVALIARLGEEWIPFWCAAKGLRIWSIKISEGIKGPFTLDDALEQAGSNPDALVRVQGDLEWRELKNFVA